MKKIFIHVWPENVLATKALFTEEEVQKLLKLTDVAITDTFDASDAISIVLLNQADLLQESMIDHGIVSKVGLLFRRSPNYHGWNLIIETDAIKGSINPLVSNFFSWDRVESQSVMSFDELMELS